MNHSGNTNKMVDTPRTEAEVNRQKCWSDDLITINANFACQLELELKAANERIKRLEEAGDRIALAYLYEPKEMRQFDALSRWQQAKEANL